MKKALIGYTTNSGSTREIALAVGEELRKNGDTVDVLRLEEVTDLSSYDAVVIGAPMIIGWHGSALHFLRKHRTALRSKRLAYFCSCINLTKTDEKGDGAFPVVVDPTLAKPPKNAKRLSLKERYATVSNYLRPLRRAAPELTPASVAFFGGKLELFRLNILQLLFVMLIIGAQPRDFRNWKAIREWSGGLRSALFEN